MCVCHILLWFTVFGQGGRFKIVFVDLDALWFGIGMACFKGQLGVPLTVCPWYLWAYIGILGDNNP